jgi:hypothetical protein
VEACLKGELDSRLSLLAAITSELNMPFSLARWEALLKQEEGRRNSERGEILSQHKRGADELRKRIIDKATALGSG